MTRKNLMLENRDFVRPFYLYFPWMYLESRQTLKLPEDDLRTLKVILRNSIRAPFKRAFRSHWGHSSYLVAIQRLVKGNSRSRSRSTCFYLSLKKNLLILICLMQSYNPHQYQKLSFQQNKCFYGSSEVQKKCCFDSITFHFALLDLGHFLFLVQVGEYFYDTLKVKTKTPLSFIAEPMYYSKKP